MYNYNEYEQKLISKMLKLGFNISNKGFNYILDAIQIIDRNHGDIKITQLYKDIADKNNTINYRVERCIRHEIELFYERAINIPTELVGNITTGKLTNSEFLCRLAYILCKQHEVLCIDTRKY